MQPNSVWEIHDLADRPQHRAAVADRLWRAFWRPDGHDLADVDQALGEVIAAGDFPFTLVATSADAFVGTVTAILTDIHERPDLGPCLAALWVEPEARRQGIAQALIAEVMARLRGQGFAQVYLSAKPHMRGFYQMAGWTLHEADVGAEHLDIFRCALP